jgi:hypothetical protein
MQVMQRAIEIARIFQGDNVRQTHGNMEAPFLQ